MKTKNHLFKALLIATMATLCGAWSHSLPIKEDPFKGHVTMISTVRKSPAGGEVLVVNIRNCGEINLYRNSQNELPVEGQKVEMLFTGRCIVSDWRKK